MGGGTTKSTDVNMTTTKSPLAAQEPFYQSLWQDASLAKDRQLDFKGDYLARGTTNEHLGIDMLAANAGRAGIGADQLRQLGLDTLGGKYLPGNMAALQADPLAFYNDSRLLSGYNPNPYMGKVMDAALRPITQQLTDVALPGIRSNAIASGAYGGSRQDLQENQAVQQWGQTAADTTSKISYQDYANYLQTQEAAKQRYAGLYSNWANNLFQQYGQERNFQNGAGTLLNSANALMNAPAQQLMQSGQAERNLLQIDAENKLQKMQGDWYALGNMANILQAGGFGTSHQVGKTTEKTQGDTGTEIMKGIMGVASLAGGLGWKPFG